VLDHDVSCLVDLHATLRAWESRMGARATLIDDPSPEGVVHVAVYPRHSPVGYLVTLMVDDTPTAVGVLLSTGLTEANHRLAELGVGRIRYLLRPRPWRCLWGRHDWMVSNGRVGGEPCLIEKCQGCRTQRLKWSAVPVCAKAVNYILNAMEFMN
jgi:hypothetical protein